MRKYRCLLFLIIFISCLAAQEGPAYTNTRQAIENHYSVKQKYGKNILSLQTKSICTYDSAGYITDKTIFKGNLTYMGRTTQNRSVNPNTRETLNYNYMNLLSTRTVEIPGSHPDESTTIEYDSKGNILSKQSTRVFEPTQDLWEMDYTQAGYAANYYQVIQDSTKRVNLKNKFDYSDNMVEKQYYVYDSDDRLVQIFAMADRDTLVFKRDFVYDDKANLSETNIYDNQENILETERCFYDNKNRIIQKSRYVWNPRFGRIPALKEQTDYEYQ